ncbi:MAG TPA: hypothetical protein VH500_04040 [Nitrososphaeraceae archaeon]|jgi:hypothetical protein
MRGKLGGQYPYHYLEMIDAIFGKDDITIEVCSGNLRGSCFKVDINPRTNPDLVEDGQRLDGISDRRFRRCRFDPPYNDRTAKEMYGTDLPSTLKLLKASARVCKLWSLTFMLLGQQNYQLNRSKIRANTINSTTKIKWIESLLQTPIEDNRKFLVWRFLVPYLINIRRLDGDEANNTVRSWLDKCRVLRQLNFNPNYI